MLDDAVAAVPARKPNPRLWAPPVGSIPPPSSPSTSDRVRGMFLVENGSIEGEITWIRAGSIHAGAKCRLEKT